jgi:cytochrome oxidase Cu insertion factor (SCO1/SenC/PrrC family)
MHVMSKATTKILWAVPALLALVFALGCGTSSQSAPSMASVSAIEALPPLGNQVGNRIHPFTLRLIDGSMVTSADLAANHRPAFLLFFKVP